MKKLILTISLFVLSNTLPVHGVEIMPLAEVKPGMTGYASTVFSGDSVENFDIEVLDIIHNLSPQNDAILIRLVGPKVEKTGVVSGMSGSPVYIDDKLVGALAYSFGSFQKDPIAGVTPIEQMMKISTMEKHRTMELSANGSGNQRLMQLALTGDYDSPFALLTDAGVLPVSESPNANDLRPMLLPLNFAGFDADVIAQHAPEFRGMGFFCVQGGMSAGSTSTVSEMRLNPGDAVSGVIVSGDLSISGTGTVTFVDGDNVYAFGHPFFNNGPVSMPMARARILTTLSSFQHSRKFSSTGDIIGTVLQDRPSGIMGVIGKEAPVFPVRIEYSSPIEAGRIYNYTIAGDKSLSDFTSIFLWLTILTTLETARFSTGDYSMNMNAVIHLKNGEEVSIDNFYTSASFGEQEGGGKDIMAAATDVAMRMIALLSNEFKYPDIESLELKFHATPGRKNLTIEKIWYDKTEIQCGDDINVSIQVREYQKEPFVIKRNIKIPEHLARSRLALAVGSGQFIQQVERNINPNKFRPNSYDELIALLNEVKRNDAIYIQLIALEKGAYINGQELSDLPPSILNIYKSPKMKGDNIKISRTVLREDTIPMEFRVFGGKTISLPVRKYKSL
ncbi:MAG: SpoIVB peptidase S55 domain-containing protein [candidate division KSB1 bacterium]|jgi:hypothetical protein|nr:SpoIVB peptidase S55 domain-containing protein [candidate division KSB1 bacterium]